MFSYLTVAANNEEEKERWLEDLNNTIAMVNTTETKSAYSNLQTCSK